MRPAASGLTQERAQNSIACSIATRSASFTLVRAILKHLSRLTPYSISLSTNGRYSQFVDLADDDLKPTGWDGHAVPAIDKPEDTVIYEGHIRDFSAFDESTTAANRGKYLAFTESGTAPVMHLQEIAAAGVTHFHVLPANDIATVNEDGSQQLSLDSTVGELCVATNASASICDGRDPDLVLRGIIESFDPDSSDAQDLINSMRGFDAFNWGYDPHHLMRRMEVTPRTRMG